MDDVLIANDNLNKAGEKLKNVHDSVADLQTEMRNQSMDFYYKLTLLAGGVLSLDITFISLLNTFHW